MTRPTLSDAQRIVDIVFSREQYGTTDEAVRYVLRELNRAYQNGKYEGIVYIKTDDQ